MHIEHVCSAKEYTAVSVLLAGDCRFWFLVLPAAKTPLCANCTHLADDSTACCIPWASNDTISLITTTSCITCSCICSDGGMRVFTRETIPTPLWLLLHRQALICRTICNPIYINTHKKRIDIRRNITSSPRLCIFNIHFVMYTKIGSVCCKNCVDVSDVAWARCVLIHTHVLSMFSRIRQTLKRRNYIFCKVPQPVSRVCQSPPPLLGRVRKREMGDLVWAHKIEGLCPPPHKCFGGPTSTHMWAHVRPTHPLGSFTLTI